MEQTALCNSSASARHKVPLSAQAVIDAFKLHSPFHGQYPRLPGRGYCFLVYGWKFPEIQETAEVALEAN